MASWRHKISLWVLSWKIFHEWAQWMSEIFFNTRREISYLQAAMSCSIYHINTNEIPIHLNIFCYKWCDLLCIRSNSVHMWRYHVFAQKLAWYFISVCIKNFLVLFLSDWNILGPSGGSLPWSEYPRETFKIRLSPNLPLIYLLFD